MLIGLRLGNFKAFSEPQRLPIRPITVMFGPNSAGKSSLIHGLLLARHAHETGELDAYRTTVGGESVDLGGFRQFVHRRQFDRAVEWSVEVDLAHVEGRLAELLAPTQSAIVTVTIGLRVGDHGEPIPDSSPHVSSYEIEGDGRSVMRMSTRGEGALRLDRLSHGHPVLRKVIDAIIQTATTTRELGGSDQEALTEAIDAVLPEILVRSDRFLPTAIRKPARPQRTAEPAAFYVSRGGREEGLAAALHFLLPRQVSEIIDGLSDAVGGELNRLSYLGPLRSYPPRHVAFAQYHDPNWHAGGGYAWDVVRRDEDVRNAVNAWLSSAERLQTPYELKVRELVGTEDVEEAMMYFLQSPEGLRGTEFVGMEPDEVERSPEEEASRFLEMMKGGRVEKLQDLILIDRRTNTPVSHRDVGIGISQVLPVLVGAYARKGSIVAIEQPEIHLHPRLQAELADVFIDSALGRRGNTFIIETHSEHLILRILRRIRETAAGKNHVTPAIKPDDLALLFVEGGPSGSTVLELRVDDKGRITDRIPGGFFEEAFEELF